MSILVINAGSSSLKFGLFDAEAREELASGVVDWTDPVQGAQLWVKTAGSEARHSPYGSADHRSAAALAIRALFESDAPAGGRLADIQAVGHRVVHGGSVFRGSVPIDREVKVELSRLSELAPLHNPPALEGIASAEEVLPGVPHVAVFDTAYYAGLAPERAVYPLPYDWFSDRGIRKFGFHGISHAYVAGRAAELLGREPDGLRVVSCHLGNGCSATASRGGIAVETTMGFTPMDGLMMGTRCGSVDPGILLHVLRKQGLSADELDDVLNHRSGLLGIAGQSSDFRAVRSSADSGDERARLAIAMFATRVRAAVGSLAVALGGLDALVFTAGIGEHAPSLRAEVCRGLECLGVHLDPDRNTLEAPDADLSTPEAPARVVAIKTREDLMIAREAKRVALDR